MCKTWTYTYACSHTLHVRLSTCRGSFTYTTKKLAVPRASCHSSASIVLRLEQACGDCQFQTAVKDTGLESQVELNTSGWYFEPIIEAPSCWGPESDESWILRKKFPSVQKRLEKSISPERRREAIRAGSTRLRAELRPEDICITGGSKWEDDWGDSYVSLAEEIESREAEKSEDVKALEAVMAAEYKAWMETTQDEDGGQDLMEEEGNEQARPSEPVEDLPEHINSRLSSSFCKSPEQPSQTAAPDINTPPSLPTAHQPSKNLENVQPSPSNQFKPPHLRRKADQSITTLFIGHSSPDISSSPLAQRKTEPPHLRRKARVTSMRRKALDSEAASEKVSGNAMMLAASFPAWSAVVV